MTPEEYYSKHGIMTDPGNYRYLFEGLPIDLISVCKVVQTNLINVFLAEKIGYNLTDKKKRTLDIRPIVEKLAIMAEISNQPLNIPRSLNQRQIGNCRDFSLLLCSILRNKNIPARTRCGFSANFEKGLFIDHWICEFRNKDENRWIMVDSQIDEVQKNELGINFDPLDVPNDEFVSAGRAWEICRRGKVDPNKFGILDMWGMRFIWSNVVRDFLALNKIEILPWDSGWGFLDKKFNDPLFSEKKYELFDNMAYLTLNSHEKFDEIRTFYENEPKLRIPPQWNLPTRTSN